MGFTRFIKNVLNVSALPTKVNNQAERLKATFDQAGADIKEALNGLISELESKDSASYLGAKKLSGESSTVQDELDIIFTSMTGKVDKINGKDLSTEDYTTIDKNKLAGIAEGANKYVLPEASTTQLGGVKVDGTTIIIENGVVKAVTADSADYTARAAIETLNTKKAETETFSATIPTSGWSSSAPYTIDITVTGMINTDSNFPVSPVYSDTADTRKAQAEAWGKISMIESGTDKITVTCDEELPTTAIPIQITVVR